MNIEKCENYVPVNHMITLVPNKFFDMLFNKNVWYWHYSGSRFIKSFNGDGNEHIDFFVDTIHWCNSSHEWNPLFVQVGRHNSFLYNECEIIQHNVDVSNFIIASKGLRYDNKHGLKYLINNDKIYDDLRQVELIENKTINLFYN